MSGLLKETNEIVKIQNEFKELSNKSNTVSDKKEKSDVVQKEELILEECEL